MNVEGKIIRERVVMGDVYQMLIRLNSPVNGKDLMVVCLYGDHLVSLASVEDKILEADWEVDHELA